MIRVESTTCLDHFTLWFSCQPSQTRDKQGLGAAKVFSFVKLNMIHWII